jgi:hypothetical protein
MEYLAAALIVTNLLWGVFAIYLMYLHNKEKKDLRDRFMARDFNEYKYHVEELPRIQDERELELKRRAKKEKKQKPLTDEERKIQRIADRM